MDTKQSKKGNGGNKNGRGGNGKNTPPKKTVPPQAPARARTGHPVMLFPVVMLLFWAVLSVVLRAPETPPAPEEPAAVPAPQAAEDAVSQETTPAEPYAFSKAEVTRFVREALAEHPRMSLTVALMADGKTAWELAFGTADRETGQPAAPETIFGIGSESKVFAAAAAMKLVEEGKLDLGRPVTDYLPDFTMRSPEAKDLTVGMLLDHSSGFPGSNYRGGFTSRARPSYPADVLASLEQSRLKHAPGYMHVYCNDGFTLFEHVLRAVTGVPYPEYVAREIFSPLGMTHTSFPLEPLPEGSYAKGYPDDEGDVLPLEYANPCASGGIRSTAGDLANFLAMIAGGGAWGDVRILSEESVAATAKDRTEGSFRLVDTKVVRYGLGWDSVAQPGLGVLGHAALGKNGGTAYYFSQLIVLPEANLGVAVLSANSAGVNLAALAELALLAALVDRGTLAALPEPLSPDLLPEATPAPEDITNASGFFADHQKLFLLQADAKGGLDLRVRSGDAWEPAAEGLRYRENGRYSGNQGARYPEYFFVRGDGRDYLAAEMPFGYGHYTDAIPMMQRLVPGAPLSPAWKARLDTTWLAADEPAASLLWPSGPDPRLCLHAVEGLEGHLFVQSDVTGGGFQHVNAARGDDTHALMDLLLPTVPGRDLSDLEILPKGDGEWLRFQGYTFRPLESVPKAPAKGEMLFLGGGDDIRWLSLPPESGTAAIEGAPEADLRWVLWDAHFLCLGEGWGAAELSLPEGGAYLALWAAPAKPFKVVSAPKP